MKHKQDGLAPIGEAAPAWMTCLRSTTTRPQAGWHFTQADQVHQLTSARH